MHPDYHHIRTPNQMPPNLPVAIPEEVGAGWRRVDIGERVRSHYQSLCFAPSVGWRLTVCPGIVHDGRTTYRRPASVRAWFTVAAQMVRKFWRKLTGNA